MNAHADKTQESQSRSVSDDFDRKRNSTEQRFQLVDNRPEALVQRKLREMANHSQRFNQTKQLQTIADNRFATEHHPIQKKENSTGLPDGLKSGIENLSGYSMDDVKVHYNSGKPAQLQAHAYAQGTDIHLSPGQEKHLPHEAWHVVQQKQGRVQPTLSTADKVQINDDHGLEHEADAMGSKAMQLKSTSDGHYQTGSPANQIVQRVYAGQNYASEHSQRTLSVDHHAVVWGGAPVAQRPARGGNRAILFETVSNSQGAIAALMGRVFGQAGGLGIWDLGLTVALNSFYVPTANNTDDAGGQSLNQSTAVPAGQQLVNVQNQLNASRTALLNAWAGPPVNISTAAWERRYVRIGQNAPVLEGARGAVPFTTLRRVAAQNPNAGAIDAALATNRAGTVWRKMGDDDMPVPAPNGAAQEMHDLASIEGATEGVTTFATFGYNLLSAGQSPEIDSLLRMVYQGEMALRQKLADLGAKTYPIEPNTYYKFSDNTALNDAWGGVEATSVGGGGPQIKEGLRFQKSASRRFVEQRTFHQTMLDTDSGGRNQNLIAFLAPALARAGQGQDPELTVPGIEHVLLQMDQSYFQPAVWKSVADQLMPVQEVTAIFGEASGLVASERKKTATSVWFFVNKLSQQERMRRNIAAMLA